MLNSDGQCDRGQWPQVNDDSGYAWGVYNANAAAGDLRPDIPGLELVVPSDVHYINAYDHSGNQLPPTPITPARAGDRWACGRDLTVEKRAAGANATACAPRATAPTSPTARRSSPT